MWSLPKHLARHNIPQLDANYIPKSQDYSTENMDSVVANRVGVNQIFFWLIKLSSNWGDALTVCLSCNLSLHFSKYPVDSHD